MGYQTKYVDGVETALVSHLWRRKIVAEGVHGNRLVTVYAGDEDYPAGTLVCEAAEYPWNGMDPDLVYDNTVTRGGRLYWDRGVFKRDRITSVYKLRLTYDAYALHDQVITADQVRQQARQEPPKIGTRCLVNIDERIARRHWHRAGTVTEIDGAFAWLEYDEPVSGCTGLWLEVEQLV